MKSSGENSGFSETTSSGASSVPISSTTRNRCIFQIWKGTKSCWRSWRLSPFQEIIENVLLKWAVKTTDDAAARFAHFDGPIVAAQHGFRRDVAGAEEGRFRQFQNFGVAQRGLEIAISCRFWHLDCRIFDSAPPCVRYWLLFLNCSSFSNSCRGFLGNCLDFRRSGARLPPASSRPLSPPGA